MHNALADMTGSGFKPHSSALTRITSVAVLILLSAFLISSVYSLHIHVTSHGQILIHSHPFNQNSNDSSKESHSHSHNELVFLTILKQLLERLVLSASLVTIILEVKACSFDRYTSVFFERFCIYELFGRPPPMRVGC
jgi:hypothetical protein